MFKGRTFWHPFCCSHLIKNPSTLDLVVNKNYGYINMERNPYYKHPVKKDQEENHPQLPPIFELNPYSEPIIEFY